MVVNERLRASIDVAPTTAAFYEDVISALEQEEIPFMLGGAFAYEVYTDIGGRTKDLDLFLHPRNVDAAMDALVRGGGWGARFASFPPRRCSGPRHSSWSASGTTGQISPT